MLTQPFAHQNSSPHPRHVLHRHADSGMCQPGIIRVDVRTRTVDHVPRTAVVIHGSEVHDRTSSVTTIIPVTVTCIVPGRIETRLWSSIRARSSISDTSAPTVVVSRSKIASATTSGRNPFSGDDSPGRVVSVVPVARHNLLTPRRTSRSWWRTICHRGRGRRRTIGRRHRHGSRSRSRSLATRRCATPADRTATTSAIIQTGSPGRNLVVVHNHTVPIEQPAFDLNVDVCGIFSARRLGDIHRPRLGSLDTRRLFESVTCVTLAQSRPMRTGLGGHDSENEDKKQNDILHVFIWFEFLS